MYEPVLTAVPEVDYERSFRSKNDFGGSQGCIAQELDGRNATNMQYYSKLPDRQNWEYNHDGDY